MTTPIITNSIKSVAYFIIMLVPLNHLAIPNWFVMVDFIERLNKQQ